MKRRWTMLALLVVTTAACSNGADGATARSSSTSRSPTTTSTTVPPVTALRTPAALTLSAVPAACPAVVAADEAPSLSGQTQPVAGDLVVHEYPVQGTTVSSLRSSLNECGPNVDGEKFGAYTRWYVNWAFALDRFNGCKVRSPKVHVRVDLYLPHHTAVGSPALDGAWTRYVDAVKVHEAGHEQHGIDAADQILQRLRHVPAASTCVQATQAANRAGQDVVDFFSHADVTYDDQTDHGTTQGAVFP